MPLASGACDVAPADQFVADVDDPHHDCDQHGDKDNKDDRAGRGRWVLHGLDFGGQRRDDRGALTAAHLLGHEIVAHDLGEDEDRAERNSGLRQGDDDVDHATPGARSGIACRFEQDRIDPRQRVRYWPHHQDGVEMHVGDDDGEIRKEQEIERLRREVYVHEEPVECAVATKKRDPRNGADDP